MDRQRLLDALYRERFGPKAVAPPVARTGEQLGHDPIAPSQSADPCTTVAPVRNISRTEQDEP